MWTIHPLYSSDILMKDITVSTEGVNNDGIVIDSSTNVIIDHASLDTEDDAIVIKSGLDQDGWRVGRPSEHIIIRSCRVGRGNGGVVIGSEMSGDVRDVSVSNCVFDGTKRGIRIKSARGRGGIVEKVTVENITMYNIESEAILFDMEYASKNSVVPTTDTAPIFRDITLRNIQCTYANTALAITGLAESPIREVVFENINIKARNGIEVSYLQNARFDDILIEAKDRPTILFQQSKSILFEGITKSGKKFVFQP
jgi:polygalacturonase